MKILLINPPRENEIIGNNPRIIEEERGFNPPLGLLHVAAYVENFTKHHIEVIDAQVEQLSYSELKDRIRSFSPDVVGMTAMTMTMVDVIKTAKIVKHINKHCPIVLGGAHVYLFPEETISLENIDYLVIGEGEIAFKELLDNIEDNEKIKDVPGLVFKSNGQIINTGLRRFIHNLDQLPFPARHLVPYQQYKSLLARGRVVTTIFTSRGCPFSCTFCGRPHLGKQFRARSAKHVVDEIEVCLNMGISEFLFYDDTFTIDKQRAIDICNEIIDRKLEIGWDIRTRVDTINEDIIKLLKKAGCQGIHYGVESGTEKVLKLLNKGITIPQVKEIFDLTRKNGIPILAYFMIGNPHETLKDIKQTFQMMKELNPDYVHLTVLTPFPGTRIYFDGLKNGIIKEDYWRHFSKHPTKEFIPPHWGEYFSRSELEQLLVKGYRSFYLRPSYIVKRMLKLKSFSELKKKAMAGFKVFLMK